MSSILIEGQINRIDSDPMVATLIGIFVFSEPLTLMSGVGVLLILAAVVILNVSNGNSRHGM